jgi:hypothetical protein
MAHPHGAGAAGCDAARRPGRGRGYLGLLTTFKGGPARKREEDARVRRWRGKKRSEARSSEAMCASKREISACRVGERGDMWFRNKNGPGIRAGVR